ncbi:MAG: mannitol dehydrogenase family protein [Firmicutes bacterium]|nr:mannitol dehydrogenase family protein [Bacillota bacterium]
MKLTRIGIKDRSAWEERGFILPDYDVDAVSKKAVEAPRWAHFGIGNIFRVFIGGIADGLIEQGDLDRGLTCIETFDFDVVDQIYTPYDCLGLSVILKGDGTRINRVLGSMAEAVKATQRDRLKEVFTSKDLQLVSFTITEKGYALKKADGSYFPYVQAEIEGGPEKATSAMAIVCAMLYERFNHGKTPLALVSMDNCSHNGDLLKQSVTTIAKEWMSRGYVTEDFLAYLEDDKQVSFPWTMIDKITPRPSEAIAKDLEDAGIENMQPVITSKRTYIAPFINAEGPQYLVIEDSFPNGRPALENGNGVYMADRNTVNLSERMKVTACLNPVHSALGPLEVVLGIDLFADGLKDPVLLKMGRTVAYGEGMPAIVDPKIISPQAFTDELFNDRFPNEYLGDTNLRLSTDVSQGVGVRFGETIKTYVAQKGTAEELVAIPLGIAGWLRYMLGVDDQGNAYELAPDPMNEELTEQFKTIEVGNPNSLTDQLVPVLSNENVFFTDLYKAGVGKKIEEMFREMIAEKGSTRKTVDKYFG